MRARNTIRFMPDGPIIIRKGERPDLAFTPARAIRATMRHHAMPQFKLCPKCDWPFRTQGGYAGRVRFCRG